MPRLSRSCSSTFFYHVIVQGINKEPIFSQNFFIENYIKYILEKLPNSKVTILAYCIMNNHAHFLVFCEEVEALSRFMQRLNTSYSTFYNKINKRVGFVFRDRFFSQQILSKKQLFNCLAYIHNNPVKAQIVPSPKDYPFSSYNEFLNKKILICNDSIRILFENSTDFLDFFFSIHQKFDMNDSSFYDIKDKCINDLIVDYENKYDVSSTNIYQNKELLLKFIKQARAQTDATLVELADALQISKSTVARYAKK